MSWFTHAIRECGYFSLGQRYEFGRRCFQLQGVRGHEQQLFEKQEQVMTSPYLSQPLLPLAIVLPRLLADIEVQLVRALPADRAQLRRRAELLRNLLTDSNSEDDALAG